MSERETYPSERSLADAREEQQGLRTHVAYPGRVQSYDAATQTADIIPLIRQQVPQPDGSYALEELPVLPSVPVVWWRVRGWFMALKLEPGDTVQLLVNSSAIGHWRAGDGAVCDPGDLRRQHLAHAVAIPGLYTRGEALEHAPSGDDALVMGADATGGTRLTFKTSGAVTITQGAAVVAQIDVDGTVHIGGAAGDFVALAGLVSARLTALQTAFDAHVHPTAALGAPSPPFAVPGVIPVGPLAPVAATKAKAT